MQLCVWCCHPLDIFFLLTDQHDELQTPWHTYSFELRSHFWNIFEFRQFLCMIWSSGLLVRRREKFDRLMTTQRCESCRAYLWGFEHLHFEIFTPRSRSNTLPILNISSSQKSNKHETLSKKKKKKLNVILSPFGAIIYKHKKNTSPVSTFPVLLLVFFFQIDVCVGVSDDEKGSVSSVVLNDLMLDDRVVSFSFCWLLLTLRSAKSVIMAGLVIRCTEKCFSPVSILTTVLMLGRRAIASCVHSRPIFRNRHASSTSRSFPRSASMISARRSCS